MLILAVSNLVLAARGGFFLVIVIVQAVFYLAAGAASIAPQGNPLSRIVEAVRTFVVVNVAIALAWVEYFRGETYTTWSPTKR